MLVEGPRFGDVLPLTAERICAHAALPTPFAPRGGRRLYLRSLHCMES
jgi:hypothetical protein